jgi:uncharacterized protein (TIGR02453 family)
MAFFTQDFSQFFIDLAPNNNKDWFDQNRKRYERSVKEPFKAFVSHMIMRLGELNPNIKELEPKDCSFRVNRDIRFSKDKTPYKMKMSAIICVGGKKNHSAEGVYFELGPEDIKIYGGIYEADKETLYTIREGIRLNLNAFQSAYDSHSFKAVYGEFHGAKNKIIPKEFKEVGEKEPLLFNKQWYYFKKLNPELISSPKLDQVIIDHYLAAKPVEQFFTSILKR